MSLPAPPPPPPKNQIFIIGPSKFENDESFFQDGKGEGGLTLAPPPRLLHRCRFPRSLELSLIQAVVEVWRCGEGAGTHEGGLLCYYMLASLRKEKRDLKVPWLWMISAP